jgi:hypothetical protein
MLDTGCLWLEGPTVRIASFTEVARGFRCGLMIRPCCASDARNAQQRPAQDLHELRSCQAACPSTGRPPCPPKNGG